MLDNSLTAPRPRLRDAGDCRLTPDRNGDEHERMAAEEIADSEAFSQ